MGRQKCIQNLFLNKYGVIVPLGLFCSFFIISDFESDTDRGM